MPYLFSYGTLQNEQVQLETFGRKILGFKDELIGYKINYIEIFDKEVLRMSNQKFHLIIEYTGNTSDKVNGMTFEISEDELIKADNYEVDDYRRVLLKLKSGKNGYVYIQK